MRRGAGSGLEARVSPRFYIWKGELVGRGTERTHVVRLADVVAGVRRTAKKRRGGGIEIDAMNTRSCFSTEEKKKGPERTVIVTRTQRRPTLVKMR